MLSIGSREADRLSAGNRMAVTGTLLRSSLLPSKSQFQSVMELLPSELPSVKSHIKLVHPTPNAATDELLTEIPHPPLPPPPAACDTSQDSAFDQL